MVYCSPVVLAVLLIMKLIKYETANSFSYVLRTYENILLDNGSLKSMHAVEYTCTQVKVVDTRAQETP